MNTLSWLIYGGDLAEGLKTLAIMAGLFAVIVSAACFFFGLASADFGKLDVRYADSAEERSAAKDLVNRRYRLAKVAPLTGLPIAFIFAAVAAAIPSKATIYMIAASEMGERVVSQPEAKEMLGDLREVIAKQIKKLRDEK